MSEEKTIEQLLSELNEAKLKLEQETEQEKYDHIRAAELQSKAHNRVRDALNVYNGISRRIDEAIAKIKSAAPSCTAWGGGKSV